MARVVLAPTAERDLEEIFLWSHERFGELARLRYEKLVVQGLLDLAEDPTRVGVRYRPELSPGARTYHLLHSRDRTALVEGARVRKPRHFLLFRWLEAETLEVARVLHDSVELARHLPKGLLPD